MVFWWLTGDAAACTYTPMMRPPSDVCSMQQACIAPQLCADKRRSEHLLHSSHLQTCRGTYFARVVVSRNTALVTLLQLPHGVPALLVCKDGGLLGKASIQQFGQHDIWEEEVCMMVCTM